MAKILKTIYFEPKLLKDSKEISGSKYIKEILNWYKKQLNDNFYIEGLKKILEIHENHGFIYITFWVEYKKILWRSLYNPDPEGNHPLFIDKDEYLVYANDFQFLG